MRRAANSALRQRRLAALGAGLGLTAFRRLRFAQGIAAPGLVEVIGPLSGLVSRHGIQDTPYDGLVERAHSGSCKISNR